MVLANTPMAAAGVSRPLRSNIQPPDTADPDSSASPSISWHKVASLKP